MPVLSPVFSPAFENKIFRNCFRHKWVWLLKDYVGKKRDFSREVKKKKRGFKFFKRKKYIHNLALKYM